MTSRPQFPLRTSKAATALPLKPQGASVQSMQWRGPAAWSKGKLSKTGLSAGGQSSKDLEAAIENLVLAGKKSILSRDYEAAFKALSKAVDLAPKHFAGRMAFAHLLDRMGKIDEAVQQFGSAVKLEPENPKPYVELGLIFLRGNRISDARVFFLTALECDPECAIALDKLMHTDAHMADWSRFSQRSKDVKTLRATNLDVNPFALLPVADDPAFQLLAAQRFARERHRLLKEEPVSSLPARQDGKIRIGYFSCDFFNHATMLLIGQLFELHDREKFSIYLYDYGAAKQDDLHKRAVQAADEYRNVSLMNDRAIAMLAREDQIDVAVDLKGYTQDGRAGIFAVRAAPVQMSFLGFPGTVGMPAMDYIVADPVVIPPEFRDAYSEKTLNMPYCYQINDRSRIKAFPPVTRAEAGLPEDAFVFCSFNNSYKISPREFDIWMDLLRQVPDSVLWCFAGHKEAEANLRVEAEKRGISGDRVIFARRLPQGAHLARHQLADLFLDTFAVNAHTTASDSLLAGVPVVTKLGRQFAARVAGSILTAAGVPELVASSDEEYAALALRLAQNPVELTAIREKIATGLADSDLFNSRQFCKDLERGIETAVHRFADGLPPDHIQL
ncbi:O-linked N-acetylglucosamine transferase, SPINDLY family protein [Leisingera sp. ANG-Vp]|uniref:O-linked N-acetylglucosamine transferase, SPINDLY family protein n=1 Tax=Leisingera sp. ANG-Vp TaxID=1577896 RepID=UPI000AF29FAB|nr:UDP-N-acetylglucosamine-peptide N-acetylglucosaminyltransferase [Leisingera sp. ANG-Vp]